MAGKKNRSGIWIMVVAAVVLEGTACVQYFASRAAIKQESMERATCELRKAELEIENHAVEIETAAKALALLVEKSLDNPDAVGPATRLVVQTIRENTSLAVAFVPGYYPKKGTYYEICSSRISEDSIFTRQIGSAEHDYTQMEWYQCGLTHDSCWWSEPYLDDQGSKTYVVSCSHPVYDKNHNVVAVVCIDLSLDYLQHVSEYLQIYPDSYYSIHSHDGMAIVPVADTVPGRKYYIFRKEIDATGWHLEIIIPDDVLFADLRRTGLFISLLMLLGMVILAFIIIHATNTAKKLIASTQKNQRMESELMIASAIQTAMLPKIFPPFVDRSDLNLYGMVDPAKEIGGDLYDFYVRHNKLFFCVGDVSGKGVPAALVMAMTRSLFRSVSSREERPDHIMTQMNRDFAEQNTQMMFLTLFLGVLDCETGQLDYCNAGHNAPVIMTHGAWRMLKVLPNLPLGIEPDCTFKSQHVQLHYGDMLFLYTDGLTEAENSMHEQFGDQRMLKTLTDAAANGLMANGYSPRHLVEMMKAGVETFVNGAEQSDDLTMLAIRYQIPALVMRNDIEQIPTLAEWLEGLDIPAELKMPINLALEEAVSNVMLYAYPNNHGQVFLEFNRTDRLVFTLTDNGIPFDPTKQKEADTTLSAEERPIGGLGIFLVRQIMDDMQYERVDGKNILTLYKKI